MTNIEQYMNEVGQRARQASRAMAKADTAIKNRALTLIAAASGATPIFCVPPIRKIWRQPAPTVSATPCWTV